MSAILNDMPKQLERLVKAGFALHLLHPKSKRPIGNDWAAKPIASLADLKRNHRDGNNVGVRLGKWSKIDGLYLHIVDVDIRKSERTDEALDTLGNLFPELDISECPTVISGSGGESRHFYFLTDRPFAPRKFSHSTGFEMVLDESKGREVKKWDWELHLLGTGSQAVIPPSIHPDTGKPYRWLRQFDFSMLDLGIGPIVPSDAVAEMVDSREEDGPIDAARQLPLGLSEADIVATLNGLPPEEWFEDREGWYRVGMALHHETGASDLGYEIWCRYSRVSKKFDEKDSRRVWKSFKNRAQAPFRMASLVSAARDARLEREFDDLGDDDLSLEDEFEDFGDDPDDMFADLLGGTKPKELSKSQLKAKKEEVEFELGKGPNRKVARLNRKHAVARVKSKTVILDFHADGTVTYGSVHDLHSYYENDRVPSDSGSTEPVSKMWMRAKHRLTFANGIVFAPNEDVEGAYNLWQGFSVDADKAKSCALFLAHLYEVICDKNDELYEYSLNYLAHMIQKPEEKPGVAYVVKGKKGAGKDTIAEYFGKIITRHYIVIANKDQMVGKFNAHQEKCLLLHVQEGFWAGDKRDEGALKYLITSENAMIEPKGMNAFPVKSVLRIFISSNEEWVVPATEDERRFFVLNVSSKRIGDHAYFAKIRHERDNGGAEALLDLLQKRDLSDFQIRKVPNTIGLAEQKVQGLKNVERWWFGVLEAGSIEGYGHSEEAWIEESLRIEKSDLRNAYSTWHRRSRFQGVEVSDVGFSKHLKRLVPDIAITQSRYGSTRHHFFNLPTLPECRRSFQDFLGSSIGWDLIEPAPMDSDPGYNHDNLLS